MNFLAISFFTYVIISFSEHTKSSQQEYKRIMLQILYGSSRLSYIGKQESEAWDMQNHNKKDQIIEIISIIMGNLIIAAGVTFFILPLDILSGGVAGIAVALQPIFNLSPRLVINGLTIGLYLLGAVLLGNALR